MNTPHTCNACDCIMQERDALRAENAALLDRLNAISIAGENPHIGGEYIESVQLADESILLRGDHGQAVVLETKGTGTSEPAIAHPTARSVARANQARQ